MMIRTRGRLAAALGAVVLLALSGCEGGASSSSGGPEGQPVQGGSATLLTIEEPRNLDPAVLSNMWVLQAAVGNALYGQLLTNDRKTGELEYRMAESLTTNDNGKTFELTLRTGLAFSDGSPLNAEAVKFNWDRLADPKTGSSSLREAALIESTEVVDKRTLKLTLRTPVPKYGFNIIANAMNWIASPDALKKGDKAFDANPIGAGPFTLESWARDGEMVLVKNPNYYDAPKPYLDKLTVRATHDAAQRYNTVASGGTDLTMETSWTNIDKARRQGLQVDLVELGAGQGFTMNTRKPPFDDIRARQAVAAAIDLNAVNSSVYNGTGEIPRTLFEKSSPFHSGVPLATHDKAKAQRLFNELAAEGKKVSFIFTTYPSTESKTAAESVQAQLSAFKNVDVKVKTVDISEVASIHTQHKFQMIISAALLIDPEPQLYTVFHGESPANDSGIDDPQLNAALQKGRMGERVEERKAAYRTVSERLAQLAPTIFYTRTSPSVLANDNVGGIAMYGMGSLLVDELWIEQ